MTCCCKGLRCYYTKWPLKERKDWEIFYWKIICEQDHSNSKQLLGDDLADNVKQVKAAHSMTQPISNTRLSSSYPRNPTSRYSSSSKASTSFTHFLNLQGRKKNFQCPQSTIKWNQKQQLRMKQNYMLSTLHNLNLI